MADRFWVGGSGDWSDDTNHWATTSGGSAGGGNKPGASDTAIFDSSSGGGTATLDEAPSITAFDMQTGNTTAVTTSGSNFALTTSGAFNIDAGLFTANASTITVGGNFTIPDTSGLFTSGTSTVVLNGTGNLSNVDPGNEFNNLTFAGAITTTLTGNITIGNTFTSGTGTIQDDGVATRVIGIDDSFINEGPTWTVSTGLKLIFGSGGAKTLPADDYGSVDIMVDGAGGTLSLDGNVTCASLEVASSGAGLTILDMVTHDLTCANLTVGAPTDTSNGQLDCGSGILTVSGNMFIHDSDFTGTGRNNTLAGESATIKVAGNWTVETVGDAGVFTAGTSIVEFNGTGTQTVTSAGISFNKILVNGTGSQVVVFDDLTTTTGKITVDRTKMTLKESVTHVIDELEWRGTPGSLASIDSGDATNTATINLATDSRATYADISHITVTTQKVDALRSRGCTDGGNNGGFAADVGVNFGFEAAVNPFLTTPIPQHELTIPSSI